MKALFTLFFFVHGFANASQASDLALAPPAFPHLGAKAVFVDMQSSNSVIEFDGATKTGVAKTTISFVQEETGYPIFDLVQEPTLVRIDGETVQQSLVTPPGAATRYRVIAKKLNPGVHTLDVAQPYQSDVDFKNDGVAAAFFFIDWNDRSYLEQYLPANTEFDQYPARITIQFKNMSKGAEDHDVFANGTVQVLNASTVQIDFPKFYNCASFYLQMAPKGQFTSKTVNFRSLDGRQIPITTFKKSAMINLDSFQKKAAETLTELERDYGPFPHNKVVIYSSFDGGKPGLGGMEYAGATITALEALGHELFHSYHGRSMAPADGNSGWMDESIAVWRDNRYPETLRDQPIVTNMAGRDAHIRYIGMEPYRQGEVFMRHLAAKATANGRSLKTFLKEYWLEKRFTIVSTKIFKADLETFTGLNLQADFNSWVYGKASTTIQHAIRKQSVLERAIFPASAPYYHRTQLTAQDRKNLL